MEDRQNTIEQIKGYLEILDEDNKQEVLKTVKEWVNVEQNVKRKLHLAPTN